MKKPIKMVALLLSLPLVLAGCKGNNNQVVENDLPEQETEENVISDNEDGEIEYDKDLEYNVYIEKNVVTPSSDNTDPEDTTDTKEPETDIDTEEPETDSDLLKENPEIAAYLDINYEEVDTKGLSKETLNLFAPCAIYLENGGYTTNGDMLSSMDYHDICDFLYDFLEAAGSEQVHGFDYDFLTTQSRMKYEDWEYLLTEVLNENNPEIVLSKLPNEFRGEVSVYYNPGDNYIYTERGALGWEQSAEVREVIREGDAFIITYDLYTLGSYLIGAAEVTIAEADNKYGYSLVGVDRIKGFDEWIWNEFYFE